MGAGSAKGLQPEDDEDADRFSTTSSGKWGNGDNSSDDDDDVRKDNRNNNKNFKKTVAEVTPNFGPGPSGDAEPSANRNGEIGDTGGDNKKKFAFNFSNRGGGDDQDKGDDSAEDADEDKKKESSKKNAKKDAEKKSGFKLFGWRNKKSSSTEEKEVELDKDIDDLEKTFDSLGIVGKNMWGDDEELKPRKESADDLELLEPMRKRKNVRVRGVRGMNGTVGGGGGGMADGSGGGSTGGGSSGSRRTFKYSWETEQETKSTKDEEDEWEYKAVVIEGFDIDKFRKANKRDSLFDSTSLPNAVGETGKSPPSTCATPELQQIDADGFDGVGVRSPLRYDQNEQQILASIERDYTFN